MHTQISAADRQRVAEWLIDARQLLGGVEGIKARIAETLGIDPEDDVIPDAIYVPWEVDRLLSHLGITVTP